MPVFPDANPPRMFNLTDPGMVFVSDAGSASYRFVPAKKDSPALIFIDMNRVVLPSDAKLHDKDFIITSSVSDVYRVYRAIVEGKEPTDTTELRAFCQAIYDELVGKGPAVIHFMLHDSPTMTIAMEM